MHPVRTHAQQPSQRRHNNRIPNHDRITLILIRPLASPSRLLLRLLPILARFALELLIIATRLLLPALVRALRLLGKFGVLLAGLLFETLELGVGLLGEVAGGFCSTVGFAFCGFAGFGGAFGGELLVGVAGDGVGGAAGEGVEAVDAGVGLCYFGDLISC
jgi:hypothetical protein